MRVKELLVVSHGNFIGFGSHDGQDLPTDVAARYLAAHFVSSSLSLFYGEESSRSGILNSMFSRIRKYTCASASHTWPFRLELEYYYFLHQSVANTSGF
jgi:hypothetical protein